MQTLTFMENPGEISSVCHEDLRNDGVESPEGCPTYLSNYGLHVSMHIADFLSSHKKADELGATHVNPHFK